MSEFSNMKKNMYLPQYITFDLSKGEHTASSHRVCRYPPTACDKSMGSKDPKIVGSMQHWMGL